MICRSLRTLCAAAIIVWATIGCTDQRPTDIAGVPGGTGLRLLASFHMYGGSTSRAPIVNARLTARRVTSGELIATQVIAVSPDDDAWTLNLAVPGNAGTVVVTIELLNADNGVEWSGETGPIEVQPGGSSTPAPVQLFQGPPDNLRVTNVTVTPGSSSVMEGGTTQLNAQVSPANISAKLLWSSLDPTVATVSSTGLVTTLRNGTARIVAEAGAHADTVTITATQRVASIAITPDTTRINALRTEFSKTARVLDPRGGEIAGAGVNWSSNNPAIVEHLGGGRFRALGNGTATITAASVAQASATASAVVVVNQRATHIRVSPDNFILSAIGAREQLSVTLTDNNGQAVTTPVAWRTANAAVATVDGNGVVTAVRGGSTEIRGVANAGAPDSLVGISIVKVIPAVASIEIVPAEIAFTAIGDTMRVNAIARDVNGDVVPDVAFTWSSTAPAIVSASANLLRSIGVGSTQIQVSAQGKTGNATARVLQTVASVQITPDSATLTAANQNVSLAIQVRDRNGALIQGRRATYTSNNTTAATVDSLGVVRPVANGYARITGVVEGVSDTVGIAVQFAATAFANLTVSSADIDSGILDDGGVYPINITLSNEGTAASAAGSLRIRLVSGANTYLDRVVPQPAIAARETIGLNVGIVLDTVTAWPDSLRIVVEADTYGDIAELDEADNTFVSDPYFVRFPVRSVTLSPEIIIMTVVGDSARPIKAAFDRRGVQRADSIALRVLIDSLQTGEAPGIAIRNGWLVGRTYAAALVEARSISTGFADTIYVQVRPVPVAITIIAPDDTIAVNDTLRLSGSVLGAGEQVLPYAIVWNSSDTAVATVSTTGLVRGRANGNVSITGRVAGHWGLVGNAVTLTVTSPPVVNLRAVRVSPYPGGNPSENGATYQVLIRNTGNVTAPASTIRLGLIHPATGAQLHAEQFGMNPMAAGDSVNMVVTLQYQANAEWPDSVDAQVTADVLQAVAEADEQDNVATGARARVNWFTMSMSVVPADTTLTAIGDSVRLRVASFDRFGRPVPDSLTLRVVADANQGEPSVALRNNGFVVALRNSAGVQIEARSRSNSLFADTVTVRIGQSFVRFEVFPVAAIGGDTTRAFAFAYDAAGIPTLVRPTWRSSNEAVFTIDSTGFVQTLPVNDTAYVIATFQQFTDTAEVIVALPEEGTRLWLGLSNEWLDPANWSGGAVPDTSEVAWIRAVTRTQPVLGNSAGVGGVIVDPGATLNVLNYDLTVRNIAHASGAITGVGRVIMSSSAGTISGTLPNVTVRGVAQVTADVTINGNLEIESGEYHVGTALTTVTGTFRHYAGELIMSHVGHLAVRGNYEVYSATATSQMSNGTLEIGGNFLINNRSAEFVPSENHQTVFNGTALQQVNMLGPSVTAQRFNRVRIANAAGVQFNTAAHINGALDLTDRMIVQQGATVYTWSNVNLAQGSTITNFGTVYHYPNLLTNNGANIQFNPLTPHPPAQ
jgi:hypothetical protein